MILQVASDARRQAFTLIELLIVIGIMLILAAVVAPIYGNLQVSGQLNENTSQIIQTLRIARERSIARLNNASHGVYFQADRYTLHQGTSYVLRESEYDREVILDDALGLSWSLTGTGEEDDINFSKGLGVPNKTGTITLTHDVSGTRQIIINSFGMVEEE